MSGLAQQKNAKTTKKILKQKYISDLPTLIFSWYEKRKHLRASTFHIWDDIGFTYFYIL
jgi:hypothetical protein